MSKVQQIHDMSVQMGANCSSKSFDVKSFIKDFGDGNAMQYVSEEVSDIYTALQALSSLCSLVGDEYDEADDMPKIVALMRGLVQFISGEIDEMEQGAEGGKKLSVSDDGYSVYDFTGEDDKHTKIAAREGVNPKEGQHKYGDVEFADEKNKKYPIDTAEHIRAAWNYINKEQNAGKYSSTDLATIRHKIIAAWKEKIDKAGPPSAQQNKSLNLAYVKSLGLVVPNDLAVKFVGKDEIRGYTFLWGNPDKVDLEHEYFTKDTDFWDGKLTTPKPLTWDHAQDVTFKADPIIGQIVDFGDDELGRWYAAKLDRSHKYRTYVDRLIQDGLLGSSSDSAPQYVVREKTGKSTWLKRWPWIASALTDVPCEPRLIGSVELLKSLGITLPQIAEASQEAMRDLPADLVREASMLRARFESD